MQIKTTLIDIPAIESAVNMTPGFNYTSAPTIPYYAETSDDLPPALREIVLPLDPYLSDQWLVFPFEGVGIQHYQAYAVRCSGSGIDVCMAVPEAGRRSLHLAPSECSAVEWSNALLHSRMTLILHDGPAVSISYNAVGEQKVRTLLLPFLDSLFSPNQKPLQLPGVDSHILGNHRFKTRLDDSFPTYETRFEVVQPVPTVQKQRSWFRTKTTAVPACALAISPSRLVVATGAANGSATAWGTTVTMIPLNRLRSLSCSEAADGAIAMQMEFGTSCRLTAIFGEATGTAISEHLEMVTSACEMVTRGRSNQDNLMEQTAQQLQPVPSGSSAQQELLRLTGVSLPEQKALEALAQIHKFKWLEAERAGFDTWAVIQPEAPLRAAAVHWVRKYFSQFNGGHQIHGDGQSVA